MSNPLKIIHQAKEFVVVNKPCGLLMHPSKIAKDVNVTLVSLLSKQLDQKVYPVHRLDRKTSGTLLVALSSERQRSLNAVFRNAKMKKIYHAIVRGYTQDDGKIDYPIKNDKGKIKEAITEYRTLKRFELNIPFGKFNTSRYSLVELRPITGRYHQLRMHMAHIFHPIIGDRPHGCNKQNKLFKDKFALKEMMLHAVSLEWKDAFGNWFFTSDYADAFQRILNILNTDSIIQNKFTDQLSKVD